MGRGVLYIAWGEPIEAQLARSLQSLKEWHPGLPVKVVRLPASSTLLDKAQMYELSPFDTTLYLDCDTTVLGNLDFGFTQAERHGIACCVNECPWGRRFECLEGDEVEYNCGVLFFDKMRARPVFDLWAKNVREVDSEILFHDPSGTLRRMSHNDQAGFAKALVDLKFNPCALPLNWNFRPAWHNGFFGPIKIWHDYREPSEEVVQHSQKTKDTRVLDFVSGISGETHEESPALRVGCAMSMPRLGITENFFSCINGLSSFGLRPQAYDGPFWGQSLELVMSKQVDNCDWILTIDYDSVFHRDHVGLLLKTAAEHPEADAIAAIQMRRGTGKPLMLVRDDNGTPLTEVSWETFEQPLMRISQAHFGLTMIRCEALRKLPHPWFLAQPNASGEWGDGKVDEDIYFWNKWREAGNSVYSANRIPCGHYEGLVCWPNDQLEPIYQLPSAFREHGSPKEAWK